MVVVHRQPRAQLEKCRQPLLLLSLAGGGGRGGVRGDKCYFLVMRAPNFLRESAGAC